MVRWGLENEDRSSKMEERVVKHKRRWLEVDMGSAHLDHISRYMDDFFQMHFYVLVKMIETMNISVSMDRKNQNTD